MQALEIMDQFIYFGSNISSTENIFITQRDKVWTDIDSLMTIWKSYLSERIKRKFLQAGNRQFYNKIARVRL